MPFAAQLTQLREASYDLMMTTFTFLNANPIERHLLILIVCLLFCVLFFDIRKKNTQLNLDGSKSVAEIAGDDLIGTQLDLAKAYIEMDQKELARDILKSASKQGNFAQKAQAQQLLSSI